MNNTDDLNDKAIYDFKKARKEFELYEKFYLSLSSKAKQYLRSRSREYRRCLMDIQDLILPSVREICSVCKTRCCQLFSPEHSIYMAGSIGGFCIADYLLTRCDNKLPEPYFENAEKNLCPFWDDGCILPDDCRSFLCVQFFCDKLKEDLDMESVSKSLEKTQAVLNSLSIGECMLWNR